MLSIYRAMVPWKEHLRVSHVAHETARAMEPRFREVVQEQTRATVASTEALNREFGASFDSLNQTLEWGFEMIRESIEALSAEFAYWMGLAVAQLQIQNQTLDNILDRLGSVDEALRTPAQTRAQELFRQAYRFMEQELLAEAVNYLTRGISEYDVDFVAHYHLGLLYLYGLNDDDDVIDLPTAVHHFRLSARYARPMVTQIDDAVRYQGEALFHGSVACYSIASELHRAGEESEVRGHLEAAAQLASEAVEVYERLAESHYHVAKYRALLGQAESVRSPLREAVHRDRLYLLRASLDADFDDARSAVEGLAEDMLGEVREAVRYAISQLTSWTQDLADMLSSPGWTQEHAERLLSELRTEIESIRTVADGGTYLDYWHALERFQSLWAHGLEESLRSTLGEVLADHVIDTTSPVQKLHPHLDRAMSPRLLRQAQRQWRLYIGQPVQLWTASLLEREASRISDLYPKVNEFANVLPDEDKRRAEEILPTLRLVAESARRDSNTSGQSRSRRYGPTSARNVLSANKLVEGLMDQAQPSICQQAERRWKSICGEKRELENRADSLSAEIAEYTRKKALGRKRLIWGGLAWFPGAVLYAIASIVAALISDAARSAVGFIWFLVIVFLLSTGLWLRLNGSRGIKRCQDQADATRDAIESNEVLARSHEEGYQDIHRRREAIGERLRR